MIKKALGGVFSLIAVAGIFGALVFIAFQFNVPPRAESVVGFDTVSTAVGLLEARDLWSCGIGPGGCKLSGGVYLARLVVVRGLSGLLLGLLFIAGARKLLQRQAGLVFGVLCLVLGLGIVATSRVSQQQEMCQSVGSDLLQLLEKDNTRDLLERHMEAGHGYCDSPHGALIFLLHQAQCDLHYLRLQRVGGLSLAALGVFTLLVVRIRRCSAKPLHVDTQSMTSQYRHMTIDQLQEILKNEVDYTPEAITLVRKELQRREECHE